MNSLSPLLFPLPKRRNISTALPKSSGRPEFSFTFDSPYEFERKVDRELQSVQPFRGQPYRLDLHPFSALANRPVARLEADLAFIAAAVYLADRAAPRYPYGINAHAYWRRAIRVNIRVSDSNHWRASESMLVSALEFLTEDDWSFTFEDGRPTTGSEGQLMLWDSASAATVHTALFSGGLDSLAGAIRYADSPSPGALLLVSGVTHSRLAICQTEQVDQLRQSFPTLSINHLQIDYGFTDRPKSVMLESSQRSRAFIHCIFGALGASMVGCASIHVYENGIGALNLPLDATQIGSQTSRGTHPIFLKRMASFVSMALGKNYSIHLPYRHLTKAEVLAHAAVRKNSDWLKLSNSCDFYPNYLHRQSHCGACPACIFRRMSLHAADLPDSDSEYTSSALSSKRHTPLSNINRMEHQAAVLRRLITKGWDALAAQFPILYDLEIEVCEDSSVSQTFLREQVLRLYRTYLEEWTAHSPFLRLLPSANPTHSLSLSQCLPTAAPVLHQILAKDSVRQEKPAA